MAATDCRLPGNPDVYGLGIRIGIYTQVISTLITNHCLPHELSSTWIANIIFVSALILALIKSIIGQSSDFFVVEGFVLLQLILLFFFAVISASGRQFVLVDFFCAFLDGNLNPETYQALKVATESKSERMILAGQLLSKLGRAYSDGSPLRYTVRLVLACTASGLNLWYWISGTQSLKHVGLECSTDVFLFARVGVTGPVRHFFIVVGTFYAAYHLAILLFATVPWAQADGSKTVSLKDKLLAAFDPRSPAERTRSEHRENLLGNKFKLPKQRKRTAISRQIHLWLHAIMFTWSTAVIIYSILAVELTLAWNDVYAVYDVGSTGQFIPLFIGLVGLARAIVSALLEHAHLFKKASLPPPSSCRSLFSLMKAQKPTDLPSIALRHDTGIYHYWVPPSRKQAQKISFKAHRPVRRWSFDAKRNGADAPTIERVLKHDAPAPVLPVQPEWEARRLRTEVRGGLYRPRVVARPSGRFIYTDRSGHRHVFHDAKLVRRASFHAGDEYEPGWPLLPHRERQVFNTPLRSKRQTIQQERKRNIWWHQKLNDLENQLVTKKHADIPDFSSERWRQFEQEDDEDSSPSGARRPSDVFPPPWLPADVNDETLLWMSSYNDAFPRNTRPGHTIHRTNSFDDSASVYNGISGRRMSFLQRERPRQHHSSVDGHHMPSSSSSSLHSRAESRGRSRWGRFDQPYPISDVSPDGFTFHRWRKTRSRSDSRNSGHSRTSPTPDEKNPGRKKTYLRRPLVLATLAVLNIFCLCMPCVSLYTLAKTLHRRWQAYRYGRKMQRNPATGPTRAKAAQYFCPECDRDLLSYRQTRDWYTVRPAVRQSNSIKKKRFVRKMEEHIGPFYTFKAVFVLVVGIFRILGRFGWGRELGRLVRARFEVLMHASEAYRQKEANVAWSASSPV